jgi:hypothetical protein
MVDKINNPILDTFPEHIIDNRLISLSITFCNQNITETNRAIDDLSTAIAQFRLQHLRLNIFNVESMTDHTLRPVEYVLRHLTINIFTYGEYHIVLHGCTYL